MVTWHKDDAFVVGGVERNQEREGSRRNRKPTKTNREGEGTGRNIREAAVDKCSKAMSDGVAPGLLVSGACLCDSYRQFQPLLDRT